MANSIGEVNLPWSTRAHGEAEDKTRVVRIGVDASVRAFVEMAMWPDFQGVTVTVLGGAGRRSPLDRWAAESEITAATTRRKTAIRLTGDSRALLAEAAQ